MRPNRPSQTDHDHNQQYVASLHVPMFFLGLGTQDMFTSNEFVSTRGSSHPNRNMWISILPFKGTPPQKKTGSFEKGHAQPLPASVSGTPPRRRPSPRRGAFPPVSWSRSSGAPGDRAQRRSEGLEPGGQSFEPFHRRKKTWGKKPAVRSAPWFFFLGGRDGETKSQKLGFWVDPCARMAVSFGAGKKGSTCW